MKNTEIRTEIMRARLHHYEVAKEMGMYDSAFSQLLRYELPDEKREEVLAAIRRIRWREMRRNGS